MNPLPLSSPPLKRKQAKRKGRALAGLDLRTLEDQAYLDYLQGSDGDQYEITRQRWAKLNWELLNKADEAVQHSQTAEGNSRKVAPLVIAAGIGFDKLYSKRPQEAKPLSFPAPLLEMVRKGLKLSKKAENGTGAEPSIIVAVPRVETLSDSAVIESAIAPVPPVPTPKRSKYAKQTPEQKQAKLTKDLEKRHEMVAKRTALVASMRQRLKQEIPYQLPVQSAGIV